MTNPIASHPITRAEVLDRLRGFRRYARRIRDKLREGGDLPNQRRHELYGQAEGLVTAAERLIRTLDAAKPITRRRK